MHAPGPKGEPTCLSDGRTNVIGTSTLGQVNGGARAVAPKRHPVSVIPSASAPRKVGQPPSPQENSDPPVGWEVGWNGAKEGGNVGGEVEGGGWLVYCGDHYKRIILGDACLEASDQNTP